MIFDCTLEEKVAIITCRVMGIKESIVWLFTKHEAKFIIANFPYIAGKTLAESLSPSVT